MDEVAMPLVKRGKSKQTRLPKSAQNKSGSDGLARLRPAILALFGLACIVTISLALLWRFNTDSVYNQKAGEAARDDIVAPRALNYASPVETEKAADEAALAATNKVYRRDENVITTQRANLSNLVNIITTARTDTPTTTRLDTLLNQPAVKYSGLNAQQIGRILELTESQWNDVVSEARNLHNMVMSMEIRADNLATEQLRLKNDVYATWNRNNSFARLDEPARLLVVALVGPFIAANSYIDTEATTRRQEEARKKVNPISVSIIKGQSIVRRGEILTLLQIEELEQLGLRTTASDWPDAIGTVGIVAALVVLITYYFTRLQSHMWSNPRLLFFIWLALMMSAVGMRVLVAGYAQHTILPYILPLAAVSMVLAALLDVNLALFFTAVLALLAGYVSHSPEMAAVFFVGGAVGAFALYKAESTLNFIYAGLAVGVGQFIVGLCFALATNNLTWSSLGLLLLANGLNGFVSTSLAFFTFSALGKLFGITTVIQLLELAHPNQPLLRRLMLEAPGTYHHSILVSNLAEQAAARLMGDALLARVGAYYHDIGKLNCPSYFIDNQGGGANIHDQLDPRESLKIIKSHVTGGVELARKHHLPRKVVDIIQQHHGTCLVSYFYQKAITQGLDVYEIDFRYPGPKPQTKVAALVMLSDGVEAAVRANVQSGRIPTGAKPAVPSIENPATAGGSKQVTIEDVVNKIIDDRIRDHQLDECDLTLKDVDELRRLFVEILAGIYHPRLVYPEPTKPGAPLEKTTSANEPIEATVREIPSEKLVRAASSVSVVGNGAADSGGEGEPPPVRPRSLGKSGIGSAGRLIGPRRERED